MPHENEKRTSTTTSSTTTTTTASSSSTRVRAREEIVNKTMIDMSIEGLRRDHMDIFGRPMPRYTEQQLMMDLENGTPSAYYQYAIREAAAAPMPSWRYVLAIVARLKRQQIPEEDLLWI